MRVEAFGNNDYLAHLFNFERAFYPSRENEIKCFDIRVQQLKDALGILFDITEEDMLFYDKPLDVMALYIPNLGYALEIRSITKEFSDPKDTSNPYIKYSLDGILEIYKMGNNKNHYYNIVTQYLPLDIVSDYIRVLNFVLLDNNILHSKPEFLENQVEIRDFDDVLYFKYKTMLCKIFKSERRLLIPCMAINSEQLAQLGEFLEYCLNSMNDF